MHIASLRKKLGDPNWISTVRGVGYRLEQQRMTRRLVVTYFTITAFALASLAIPLGVTFAHREKDRLLFAIERDADAMAAAVQAAVAQGKPPPSHGDPASTRHEPAATSSSSTTNGIALLDTRVSQRSGPRLLDPARDHRRRSPATGPTARATPTTLGTD